MSEINFHVDQLFAEFENAQLEGLEAMQKFLSVLAKKKVTINEQLKAILDKPEPPGLSKAIDAIYKEHVETGAKNALEFIMDIEAEAQKKIADLEHDRRAI